MQKTKNFGASSGRGFQLLGRVLCAASAISRAKLLRLKSVGLHLGLCIAALNSEQVLDVLGIRKLARRCEASLSVLLGEQDGSVLESS